MSSTPISPIVWTRPLWGRTATGAKEVVVLLDYATLDEAVARRACFETLPCVYQHRKPVYLPFRNVYADAGLCELILQAPRSLRSTFLIITLNRVLDPSTRDPIQICPTTAALITDISKAITVKVPGTPPETLTVASIILISSFVLLAVFFALTHILVSSRFRSVCYSILATLDRCVMPRYSLRVLRQLEFHHTLHLHLLATNPASTRQEEKHASHVSLEFVKTSDEFPLGQQDRNRQSSLYESLLDQSLQEEEDEVMVLPSIEEERRIAHTLPQNYFIATEVPNGLSYLGSFPFDPRHLTLPPGTRHHTVWNNEVMSYTHIVFPVWQSRELFEKVYQLQRRVMGDQVSYARFVGVFVVVHDPKAKIYKILPRQSITFTLFDQRYIFYLCLVIQKGRYQDLHELIHAIRVSTYARYEHFVYNGPAMLALLRYTIKTIVDMSPEDLQRGMELLHYLDGLSTLPQESYSFEQYVQYLDSLNFDRDLDRIKPFLPQLFVLMREDVIKEIRQEITEVFNWMTRSTESLGSCFSHLIASVLHQGNDNLSRDDSQYSGHESRGDLLPSFFRSPPQSHHHHHHHHHHHQPFGHGLRCLQSSSNVISANQSHVPSHVMSRIPSRSSTSNTSLDGNASDHTENVSDELELQVHIAEGVFDISEGVQPRATHSRLQRFELGPSQAAEPASKLTDQSNRRYIYASKTLKRTELMTMITQARTSPRVFMAIMAPTLRDSLAGMLLDKIVAVSKSLPLVPYFDYDCFFFRMDFDITGAWQLQVKGDIILDPIGLFLRNVNQLPLRTLQRTNFAINSPELDRFLRLSIMYLEVLTLTECTQADLHVLNEVFLPQSNIEPDYGPVLARILPLARSIQPHRDDAELEDNFIKAIARPL
ncbi:hypothetical protein GMRT_10522 [Giardia muris]|uniref:Uncharacterized protein n=1 Tax=Giardia muris TaxID=5742 RepID=A0A4Z1STC6_GIAMU|nr:hypothetical protein GMRT_10522 [Giardia muris]|eukprot:TNJ26898.1 hypothetical protein GMRT_10522 [Giardia muris]